MNITTSDDPNMLKWLAKTLEHLHGQSGVAATRSELPF
jgi:hypothetical protein